MKILFLHGLESSPNSTKATFLREKGHDVIAPELDKNNWEQSVLAARHAIMSHNPDVVVGSSRGGAVAMAARPAMPLILVAPAWVKYAPWATISARTTVIHSIEDDIVPFEHSEKLRDVFGANLIEAGMGHRMSDFDALAAILSAVEAS
jgi:predicted alpha/beta hydrolase family esterase